MIKELKDLSYESHLLECGLTTQETRRLRGDEIEVFKIVNRLEDIDRNMHFKHKEGSRTRGMQEAEKTGMKINIHKTNLLKVKVHNKQRYNWREKVQRRITTSPLSEM